MAEDWQERVLAGVPAEVAQAYRDPKLIAFLDRALDGVSESAKVEALRVMVNLRIPPNDELNVILALLGMLRDIGEAAPRALREVVGEMESRLNGFVEATQLFDETARAMMTAVIDEIHAQALDVGKASAQSASIEEIEKYRLRLLVAQKDVMGALVEQVRREMQALAGARVALRARVVSGVLSSVLLLVGVGAGWLGGQHGASVDARVQREASSYVRMWQDSGMPVGVRTWWVRWARTH